MHERINTEGFLAENMTTFSLVQLEIAEITSSRYLQLSFIALSDLGLGTQNLCQNDLWKILFLLVAVKHQFDAVFMPDFAIKNSFGIGRNYIYQYGGRCLKSVV